MFLFLQLFEIFINLKEFLFECLNEMFTHLEALTHIDDDFIYMLLNKWLIMIIFKLLGWVNGLAQNEAWNLVLRLLGLSWALFVNFGLRSENFRKCWCENQRFRQSLDNDFLQKRTKLGLFVQLNDIVFLSSKFRGFFFMRMTFDWEIITKF